MSFHTFDDQIFHLDFCSLEIETNNGGTRSLLESASLDHPRLVVLNGAVVNSDELSRSRENP